MACPSREPRSQCSDKGFTFLPFSRHFLRRKERKKEGGGEKNEKREGDGLRGYRSVGTEEGKILLIDVAFITS